MRHFPGLERLPTAVGRGGLRRHQRAQAAARQGVETRHRVVQQVSTSSSRPGVILKYNQQYFIV